MNGGQAVQWSADGEWPVNYYYYAMAVCTASGAFDWRFAIDEFTTWWAWVRGLSGTCCGTNGTLTIYCEPDASSVDVEILLEVRGNHCCRNGPLLADPCRPITNDICAVNQDTICEEGI
jgi:hypothetical protein